MAQELPRDVFINAVFDEALRNRDLYFISADLGAQALDRFRAEAPGQFIHAGISEQNMIDVAAGMALNGKLVYVYAMAPFVTLRCYEQLKVAIASMGLPLTIVGVGAGFSYDDAGPTHYATEDVTCMRALAGIEIVTPGDTQAVLECARQTFRDPALRYVRLDRQRLPDVYPAGDTRFLRDGLVEIDRGSGMCLVANGYMLQKAREVRTALGEEGVDLGIVDAYRVKPIDSTVLARVLGPYDRVVTLEEHFLSGGLGSALLESMADSGMQRPVKRFGIADRYYCENGGREYLHRLAGLDVPTVTRSVLAFAKRESCPATS